MPVSAAAGHGVLFILTFALVKDIEEGFKCMKNTRRFERFDIGVPVRIELIQSRRKRKVIKTYISDLSAIGVFLPELKSLPVGQMLRADIYFLFEGPNPSCQEGYELVTMTVTGRVVRSGSTGTGIAFNEDYGVSSRRIVNGRVKMKDIDDRDAACDSFKIMSRKYLQKNPQAFKEKNNEPEAGCPADDALQQDCLRQYI